MISDPSIDRLLDNVNSRYSLAILAAKRAHEIEAGDAKMMHRYESPRYVGKALEEVADGRIKVDPKSDLSERVAEKADFMEEAELEQQNNLANNE